MNLQLGTKILRGMLGADVVGLQTREHGTELAARKLERVLTTDPAMGVLRHADAGYERAIEVARERGVHVPMLDG